MRVVDTNILVYSHRQDNSWHEKAAALIKNLAEGQAAWAIPWQCLREFYAVVTHPKIFKNPTTPTQAITQIKYWLESPSLSLLGEGTGYMQNFEEVTVAGNILGSAVHDAAIAAICKEHQVDELYSADRDFGRFKGLKVRNPLV